MPLFGTAAAAGAEATVDAGSPSCPRLHSRTRHPQLALVLVPVRTRAPRPVRALARAPTPAQVRTQESATATATVDQEVEEDVALVSSVPGRGVALVANRPVAVASAREGPPQPLSRPRSSRSSRSRVLVALGAPADRTKLETHSITTGMQRCCGGSGCSSGSD